MLKHVKIGAKSTITNIDSKMEQMNAIDVRVSKVYLICGQGVVGEKSRSVPSHVELAWVKDESGEKYIDLQPHYAYAFDTPHYVEIAEGEAGIVIGRSTLNRSGCQVWSCLFDSGFTGYIGGVFYPHCPLRLYENARVGQFLLMTAETAKMYEGIYKH